MDEQENEPIAVAIPTADRPEALERLLGSVLGGEQRPQEIVVVDQGDADATAAVVDELSGRGTPVHRVADDGRGLSRSRNLALRATTAPLVAFIDDDCVATPGWLAAVSAAFSADPELTAVTGPALPLGPPEAGRFAVSSRTSRDQRTFHGDVLP